MSEYHENNAHKNQYAGSEPELQWAEDSINGLFAMTITVLGRLIYIFGWAVYCVFAFAFGMIGALLRL